MDGKEILVNDYLLKIKIYIMIIHKGDVAMYKLIAIDLDGTLLDSKKTVSQENIRSIKNAMNKGVRVAICTGRPYSGIRPFAKAIGLDNEKEYIISQNGGCVINGDETNLIAGKYFTYEETKEIVEAFESMDIGVVLVTYEDYISYNCNINNEMKKDADMVFKKLKEFNKENIKLEDLKLFKIMLSDEYDKISAIYNKIPQHIKDNYYVVKTMPYLIEIMPKNVNKGYGLLKLTQHLNLKNTEVMAIGDELNDIEMFEFAGLKVAMKNANDIIKSKADFITLSNDENGVSHAIEHFIK